MKIIIITNCSKSKKLEPDDLLKAKDLKPGSLDKVSNEWISRIQKSHEKPLPAKDLYSGRSFKEIISIDTQIQYEWYIVSAGFGFIRSDTPIQSYDLTVTNSSINSIIHKIDDLFNLSEWYVELNKKQNNIEFPIAQLVDENKDSLFLFGLSKSYYELIKKDLEQIKDRSNLRFFGFEKSANLNKDLKQYFMPYDLRFDGPDSDNNGIKNDFPRRVLRHYVEHILPKMRKPNLKKEKEHVQEYISRKREYVKKNNKRFSDTDLIKKIIDLKKDYPNSRKLLAYFRENQVACAEERFRGLYKQALISSGGTK